MPRSARKSRQSVQASPQTSASLSEEQAAQLMWDYYRDHKSQLISDIKEYRETILRDLMRGVPAVTVFAAYSRSSPAKSLDAKSARSSAQENR